MKEITLLANAKINLYLDITGKRDDGYHLLETVMQSVDLCDIVTVRLGVEGIRVGCSDPGIPADEENICGRVARAFFETADISGGAEIFIEKRIPHGAGLGGGSADAAAALVGLNTLYGEALPEKRLMTIAAKIGADVPFCMVGGTKLCTGIGDVLHETEPFSEKAFLVVMPDFRCMTKDAYSRWDKSPVPYHGGAESFLKAGDGFSEKMYNVFAELYDDKRIYAVTDRLRELGAEGAGLSGSGAAMFGVFPTAETAMDAARSFPNFFTAVCKPVSKGILIVDRG